MPKINLNYPANYYVKGLNTFYPELAITTYEYDAATIERVLDAPTALNDMQRVRIQFGNQAAPLSYNVQNIKHIILNEAAAHAQKNSVDLTRAEVTAIYAFACSVNGIVQQGGYFSLTELLVKHIFRIAGLPPSDRSTGNGSYLHVVKSNGQIIVTHIYQTDRVHGYQIKKSKNQESTDLIFKSEEFILTEKNGVFSCEYNAKKNFFELDKGYFDLVIPALKKILEQKSGSLTAEEYFHLTPFLVNDNIRDKFITSLSKQDLQTQAPIRELIKLCFAHDKKFLQGLLAKYDKKILQNVFPKKESPPLVAQTQPVTPALPLVARKEFVEAKSPSFSSTFTEGGDSQKIALVPFNRTSSSSTLQGGGEADEEKEQKVLPEKKSGEVELDPAFKMARDNLIETLKSPDYSPDLLAAAQCVVDEIMTLPLTQIASASTLLTRILKNTEQAIRLPQDFVNLKELQDDLKAVQNRNWQKLALAIATVALGAMILILSAITLAASFGSSSFFSSWGIAFSSSALTKGFSVIGMAAGIGVMGVGVGFSEDQPLKKVYLAGHTFFSAVSAPKLTMPDDLTRDLSRASPSPHVSPR